MSRISTIIALLACCFTAAFAQNTANTQSPSHTTQAKPAPSQPIHVSSEVMLGLVEHKTMPVYPDEAMRKGIQGDVIFKVQLDETGKMVSRALVAGDPLLVTASVDALQNTRFRPYLLNGTAASVESQLGFHFSVEKNAGGVNGHVECISSIPDPPAS
jgi:TonB family protein